MGGVLMNPWLCNLLFNNSGGSSLPVIGQTFYASLKTSLVPEVGTGAPTWSRATAAWRFNDQGYLRQIPSECAEFGGARLVQNNINTKSEDFTNAAWTKSSMTVASIADTPPIGVSAAFSSIPLAATAQHYIANTGSVYPIGSTVVFGVYAKSFGYSFIRVYGPFANCYFNVSSGIVGTSAGANFVSASITNAGNGWYLCNVKAVVTSATVPSFELHTSPTETVSYLADGISGCKFAGFSYTNVTGYDASYVPEYVSVGVLSPPYHGAGADGCKYFATDWQGAPIPVANLTRLRKDTAGTNALLWSRDLSNAAWSTKTNITAAKTATGLDGIANSASTLTATSADAIILQPTSGIASAARCSSAYVRRKTGTGTISFTQDGGSTWTDITPNINSATYSRVQITATLANPSVGFKISTSGDVIAVDCVQNEAGAVATSPIVTTTTTVNRSADSLTDQTSSNWSDTAGTAYILAKPVVYSGGAVGSATNGLLLSASNSGATAYDGTNSANGPTGTPGAVEKLALAWGSSTMSVASSGLVGTPGTYDGAMGLSSIGVGVGAVGYFGDVAIYNYKMTDAELQAITT